MFSARAFAASRRASRATLRALAGLVAVLLGLSSLGQVAHFLLVPHAICAEHGELLELSEVEKHVDLDDAAEPSKEERDHAAVTTSELASDHDHCQVLSRGQREQLAPPPPSHALPDVTSHEESPRLLAAATARPLTALTLAPKTSPPAPFAG